MIVQTHKHRLQSYDRHTCCSWERRELRTHPLVYQDSRLSSPSQLEHEQDLQVVPAAPVANSSGEKNPELERSSRWADSNTSSRLPEAQPLRFLRSLLSKSLPPL